MSDKMVATFSSHNLHIDEGDVVVVYMAKAKIDDYTVKGFGFNREEALRKLKNNLHQLGNAFKNQADKL